MFDYMARLERFELPTARFVAEYSIQLSYGRIVWLADSPARAAHITVPGCCRKGRIPLIHGAAGPAVASRQGEELQFPEIAAERAFLGRRTGPKPLHPARRLGHVVVVELLP